MQSREWQRFGGGVNDSLGIQAVGIIDVIRDEQAAVRIQVHAMLIALLFARQQHQIRQNLVAENSLPPGSRVRPPNPAMPLDNRLRRFQFMDTIKEFPALPRRQRLDLFQNIMCAHLGHNSTNWAFRASLVLDAVCLPCKRG